MRRGRAVLLLVVVFVVLALAAVAAILWSILAPPAPSVPERAYLEVDLTGPLDEIAPPDVWSSVFFGARGLTMHDLWTDLRRARTDPRIRAVLLRVGAGLGGDWAKMSEVRDLVAGLRAAGKKVYAYAEEVPEFDRGYYLATACDRIVIHPVGWMGVNGIGGWVPFFKTALDKLGIRAEFEHVAEFKTAYNQFTESGFTPAHREELTSLYGDLFATYVETASKARGKSPADFRALLDRGIFQGEQAKAAGLVDDVLYMDELRDRYLRDGGDRLRRVRLPDYHEAAVPSFRAGGRRVALIYGVGAIVSGESVPQVMGGDTVARWIRAARTDDSIAAIVFRVDSPGGSSVASDVIGREVALAREAKPVVVSMSDVAGSGGYWIAMAAHKIVAQPQTLTGSIGVLAGKFSLAGLYEKLGITAERLTFGAEADEFTTFRDFTPAERQGLYGQILYTYGQFVDRVAKYRKMPREKVEEVAKGRVWTGRQALERGLVDELGGLTRALEIAKSLAKIPAGEEVRTVVWPRRRSVWQVLTGRGAEPGGLGLPGRMDEMLVALKVMRSTRVWAMMPFWLKEGD